FDSPPRIECDASDSDLLSQRGKHTAVHGLKALDVVCSLNGGIHLGAASHEGLGHQYRDRRWFGVVEHARVAQQAFGVGSAKRLAALLMHSPLMEADEMTELFVRPASSRADKHAAAVQRQREPARLEQLAYDRRGGVAPTAQRVVRIVQP